MTHKRFQPYAKPTETNFAPFDGDGRFKVGPIEVRPNTVPRPVTHAQARRLIEGFSNRGVSYHSAMGSMLWVLEAWAKEQGKPIKVSVSTFEGRVEAHIVELMK